MTSDCPDGFCKQKIQAVDHAIGHDKNEWATLLHETKSYDDVKQALRFCETFKLEAKVCILEEGFSVQVKSEVIQNLNTLSSRMRQGNLYDEKKGS